MFLEITPNFSLREWKCSETKVATIYCWVMAQVAAGCAASNQVAVHDSGFQLESCVHIYTVQLTICILKSDLCKIQLVPYHPRYKFCISQRVLVRTLLNCREHLVKHSAITTIITTLPSYGQLSERWIFFLTYKQLVIMFYCCCRGNYHSYIWHRYPRLLGCWEWRHTCQVQDWLVTIS